MTNSRRARLISNVRSYFGSLIRLHCPSSLRGRDPRVVGVFGVANLACDLGDRAGDTRSPARPQYGTGIRDWDPALSTNSYLEMGDVYLGRVAVPLSGHVPR
jgi:hypothetical protein